MRNLFDWGNRTGLVRDKIYSVLIVGILFAGFSGLVQVRVGEAGGESGGVQPAAILSIAGSQIEGGWSGYAEEQGPFPGGLEVPGGEILAAGGFDPGGWNQNTVKLVDFDRKGSAIGKVRLAERGEMLLPRIPVAADETEVREVKKMVGKVVLQAYEKNGVVRFPDDLPPFAGADLEEPGPWRYAVNLRSNGTVKEILPMIGGGELEHSLETWLRGVRFKEGPDDQWIALRVEVETKEDDRGSE